MESWIAEAGVRVIIQGGGVAGQVLCRELSLRGIAVQIQDITRFPRPKVCGGVLQWDSWEYLNSIFELREPHTLIETISHHWSGRMLSEIRLPKPMVLVPRMALDASLDRQQRQSGPPPWSAIRVAACGAPPRHGRWIGFQTVGDPVEGLEMHYHSGVCLGRAPAPDGSSHISFILRRELFRSTAGVRQIVRKKLGIRLEGPLRGTKSIGYGGCRAGLAVGDAKLTTHPFLGLGMKHAIESARLLAECIASGKIRSYDRLHARMTRRWRAADLVLGSLFDSRASCALRMALRSDSLFLAVHQWLHGSKDRGMKNFRDSKGVNPVVDGHPGFV